MRWVCAFGLVRVGVLFSASRVVLFKFLLKVFKVGAFIPFRTTYILMSCKVLNLSYIVLLYPEAYPALPDLICIDQEGMVLSELSYQLILDVLKVAFFACSGKQLFI